MPKTRVRSVSRTLTLHLLPGALATVFFLLAGPPLIRAGYPPLLALFLAILVILIPFELGYLFYEGKRSTGSFSLRSVVSFRERIPTWQYLVLVPVLLAWSAAAFTFLARFDTPLAKTLFSWLPAWSVSAFSPITISQYPCGVLIMSFIAGLVLNGIAGPVVEELHFPRLPTPSHTSREGLGTPNQCCPILRLPLLLALAVLHANRGRPALDLRSIFGNATSTLASSPTLF